MVRGNEKPENRSPRLLKGEMQLPVVQETKQTNRWKFAEV